jgi:hypothetical protein
MNISISVKKHSTHNPEIKGSNLAYGTGKGENGKNVAGYSISAERLILFNPSTFSFNVKFLDSLGLAREKKGTQHLWSKTI